MLHVPSVLSAAAFAASSLLTSTAAADELDSFEIDVILEDLEDAETAEEFEQRLKRSAKRYCQREAPYANAHQRRDCQERIILAVEEHLEEEEGIVIALSDNR